MWTSLRDKNPGGAPHTSVFYFQSLGALSNSHSKDQRRKSPCVSGRAGESGYFEICPGHSVLLTKTCPWEKLLYQSPRGSLTNLGELKYPTQAPCSLPVCPKGKTHHTTTKLRSPCEIHSPRAHAHQKNDESCVYKSKIPISHPP